MSKEVLDTERKAELVEAAIQNASKDHSTSKASFEKLLTLGETVKVDLSELIEAASSKLTLLARVTKLEDELVRVEGALESKHYDYEALKETHEVTKRDYDRRLTASRTASEEFRQQLENLRTAYDELSASNSALKKTVRPRQSIQSQETYERDIKKLQRAYASLKEEVETKEELLSSLKNVVQSASSESDDASMQLQNQQKFHAQVVAQYDKKVNDYEQEIVKMKRGWIRDVEVMNSLKIEKETLEVVTLTQKLQMLDQKWLALCQEHQAALKRCEDLKREARANLIASSHVVEPDSHSATGSVRRLELEHQKQIKALNTRYEQTMLELNDEIDRLRDQLRDEKQWSRSLEEANVKLDQQYKSIIRPGS